MVSELIIDISEGKHKNEIDKTFIFNFLNQPHLHNYTVD